MHRAPPLLRLWCSGQVGAFFSTVGVCVALGLTVEVSCHHHQALGALGKSEEQDSGFLKGF